MKPNANKIKYIILVLSCVCLLYASLIMFVHFIDIDIDVIPKWMSMLIGMALNLGIIPFVYLLCILLSINIVIIHLKKWSIESEFFISTLILIAIMVLLCVVIIW